MERTESFQEFSYLLKLFICIRHQLSVERIHIVLFPNSVFCLIALCLFYPNLKAVCAELLYYKLLLIHYLYLDFILKIQLIH